MSPDIKKRHDSQDNADSGSYKSSIKSHEVVEMPEALNQIVNLQKEMPNENPGKEMMRRMTI
jgi:hypothetical protein